MNIVSDVSSSNLERRVRVFHVEKTIPLFFPFPHTHTPLKVPSHCKSPLIPTNTYGNNAFSEKCIPFLPFPQASTPSSRFHEAASSGDVTTMMTLVTEGGIDVDIADDRERTALHVAADRGQLPAVSFLIEQGEE